MAGLILDLAHEFPNYAVALLDYDSALSDKLVAILQQDAAILQQGVALRQQQDVALQRILEQELDVAVMLLQQGFDSLFIGPEQAVALLDHHRRLPVDLLVIIPI